MCGSARSVWKYRNYSSRECVNLNSSANAFFTSNNAKAIAQYMNSDHLRDWQDFCGPCPERFGSVDGTVLMEDNYWLINGLPHHFYSLHAHAIEILPLPWLIWGDRYRNLLLREVTSRPTQQTTLSMRLSLFSFQSRFMSVVTGKISVSMFKLFIKVKIILNFSQAKNHQMQQ